MEKMILIILQKSRMATAVRVQEILTEYGCFIQARLGLHDGPPKTCSDSGLIIIEMAGDKAEIQKCKAKLVALENVSVELVTLSV
ncbi:MAG: hypothetical protein CVV50_00580 [Spirochaetae bacterium HGW-Spirochaetae-6]|nr:MAG: hypothetical protein CVV50_00580 [Spirochaetae bacterium HGW-Spirochaetae-6]